MAQRYVVSLEEAERKELLRLIHTGKGAARKLSHARILLHADQASQESRRTDEQIAAALEVSVDTVERVRRRFVEEGLEAAMERKPSSRAPRQPVIDGEAEAKLIALCCSDPPEGRARWTRLDWAYAVREMVDVWYPDAELIRLVMDNLNTHSLASLYEAFDPEEAQRIRKRLEIHHTPKLRVDWQFTTADARIKLHRLYPVLRP